MRGELVGPADRGYETHRRVWNGSIDRHPALIVRCAGVADVIDAVRFARRVGLPVAVRSGGHRFPRLVSVRRRAGDRPLPDEGVRVDLASRTVRAQAGVRLGELDRETQAFGLAVPAGIVTHTGLAGLTLGGGIGWLMRKYGLTIDQLRSVDLVTADGELVKASAQENSDLFWGVRGAGGTSASSPSSSSSSTPSVPRSSPDRSSGRWSSRRRCCASTATGSPTCRTSSPRSSCTARRRPCRCSQAARPTHRHGYLLLRRTGGGGRAGRPAAQGLRPPLIDLCTRTPFVKHQAMFDASFPEGWWYYFRSCDVATLTDEVIDITAEHAQRIRSPLTAFPIFHLGGAVGRVSDDETAFHGRTAGHTFNINATTATRDGFEEEREWSRSFWSALQPYHTGVYVNFLMDEGEQRIRDAYGTDKYDRAGAETQVRPGQLLPPQPEHPTRLASVERRPEQKREDRGLGLLVFDNRNRAQRRDRASAPWGRWPALSRAGRPGTGQPWRRSRPSPDLGRLPIPDVEDLGVLPLGAGPVPGGGFRASQDDHVLVVAYMSWISADVGPPVAWAWRPKYSSTCCLPW